MRSIVYVCEIVYNLCELWNCIHTMCVWSKIVKIVYCAIISLMPLLKNSVNMVSRSNTFIALRRVLSILFWLLRSARFIFLLDPSSWSLFRFRFTRVFEWGVIFFWKILQGIFIFRSRSVPEEKYIFRKIFPIDVENVAILFDKLNMIMVMSGRCLMG